MGTVEGIAQQRGQRVRGTSAVSAPRPSASFSHELAATPAFLTVVVIVVLVLVVIVVVIVIALPCRCAVVVAVRSVRGASRG